MSSTSWRQICADLPLWVCTKQIKSEFSLNTIALRLADGTLLLYSPSRGLGDATHRQLTELGKVSAIVAPNHFHHLGLAETHWRYPESTLHCSETARPRLQARHRDLEFQPLEALATRLSAQSSFLICEGTKTGEVWIEVTANDGTRRAWVVCDAFFNIPTKGRGLMGLLLRWTKTVPGLRVGRTFRWLALADRKRYRAWLENCLVQRPPTDLIPCHGEVASGLDLAERLAAQTSERLAD